MTWKILGTLLLLVVTYTLIRVRQRRALVVQGRLPPPEPLFPPGVVRRVALVLIAITLIATSVHLVQSWRWNHQEILVQVVNANTGAITNYLSRRGEVDGRRFVTRDGREIRLADVERMIILPVPEHPGVDPADRSVR